MANQLERENRELRQANEILRNGEPVKAVAHPLWRHRFEPNGRRLKPAGERVFYPRFHRPKRRLPHSGTELDRPLRT